ncbi:hypothetical protein [Desulfosarcina sp.]|uniref:hypothetical protein n=1 Tax=Desulfosarcina sp. TaxID=2027861 RepID=UPI0029A0DB2E|nr:hypothetical protein [Desulfosarcina sp.]MDX2454294.1 hypothetical protein [Desulfosarcina sp.]
MDRKEVTSDLVGRLEDFIISAQRGKTVQLQTIVYEKYIKEVSRSNATDDMDLERDRCLLVADFTLIRPTREKPAKVSKAYMICPVNENEIDRKTTRHIANERLRMDFSRLRKAGIEVEEQFF